jgi:hypothetical protein
MNFAPIGSRTSHHHQGGEHSPFAGLLCSVFSVQCSVFSIQYSVFSIHSSINIVLTPRS